MKIGVVGGGSMGDAYGPKYGTEFFQKLWKESLLDHLTSEDEVVWLDHSQMRNFDQAAGDFDAIIGAWIVDNMLNEELLEKHPHLHYVSTLAHGFGYIDPEVVHKHDLTVTNTVYGDVTIAQYAFALLMDICHDVHANDEYYREEKWLPENNGKRMLVKTRQIELYEKTFGIVGLGNIGYCAAKIAQGFGMKVIAYSRHKKEGEKYDFIEQVSFDELLERSDVISIHCPLTESTRHLIDAEAFKKMKEDVIIINTARGAIIDEDELIENLESGKVYAAGLDVLTGEPLKEPAKIMKCKHTRLTEHIAWAPVESRIRSIRIGCQNFLNWKAGHPTSVVV
ncbi:MAG: D-2-hydroxyacid dehydrogenase [Lachnospiraceae bacterium]|nr:D-2-hydroxyacid dehydrogenase [Lachnospiraceae bacterium]